MVSYKTISLEGKMKYKRYTAYVIITTMLEETVLVAAVLWLLPRFGINIPLWGLILMMIALGIYACVTYRLGKKALDKKPIFSPDVGKRGRAVTPISPTGYVRINGELWRASCSSSIGAGEEIAVVGMEGMTLLISPVGKANHECRVNTPLDNH